MDLRWMEVEDSATLAQSTSKHDHHQQQHLDQHDHHFWTISQKTITIRFVISDLRRSAALEFISVWIQIIYEYICVFLFVISIFNIF